jgi:hypothetical protein
MLKAHTHTQYIPILPCRVKFFISVSSAGRTLHTAGIRAVLGVYARLSRRALLSSWTRPHLIHAVLAAMVLRLKTSAHHSSVAGDDGRGAGGEAPRLDSLRPEARLYIDALVSVAWTPVGARLLSSERVLCLSAARAAARVRDGEVAAVAAACAAAGNDATQKCAAALDRVPAARRALVLGSGGAALPSLVLLQRGARGHRRALPRRGLGRRLLTGLPAAATGPWPILVGPDWDAVDHKTPADDCHGVDLSLCAAVADLSSREALRCAVRACVRAQAAITVAASGNVHHAGDDAGQVTRGTATPRQLIVDEHCIARQCAVLSASCMGGGDTFAWFLRAMRAASFAPLLVLPSGGSAGPAAAADVDSNHRQYIADDRLPPESPLFHARLPVAPEECVFMTPWQPLPRAVGLEPTVPPGSALLRPLPAALTTPATTGDAVASACTALVDHVVLAAPAVTRADHAALATALLAGLECIVPDSNNNNNNNSNRNGSNSNTNSKSGAFQDKAATDPGLWPFLVAAPVSSATGTGVASALAAKAQSLPPRTPSRRATRRLAVHIARHLALLELASGRCDAAAADEHDDVDPEDLVDFHDRLMRDVHGLAPMADANDESSDGSSDGPDGIDGNNINAAGDRAMPPSLWSRTGPKKTRGAQRRRRRAGAAGKHGSGSLEDDSPASSSPSGSPTSSSSSLSSSSASSSSAASAASFGKRTESFAASARQRSRANSRRAPDSGTERVFSATGDGSTTPGDAVPGEHWTGVRGPAPPPPPPVLVAPDPATAAAATTRYTAPEDIAGLVIAALAGPRNADAWFRWASTRAGACMGSAWWQSRGIDVRFDFFFFFFFLGVVFGLV